MLRQVKAEPCKQHPSDTDFSISNVSGGEGKREMSRRKSTAIKIKGGGESNDSDNESMAEGKYSEWLSHNCSKLERRARPQGVRKQAIVVLLCLENDTL